MKLCCVECHTEFQLDPNRINENGSMVRCLKCSYIFTVYPPDINGSAVTQDTNIEQEILDDLFEMQKNSPSLISDEEPSSTLTAAMPENIDSRENIKEGDLNPNDAYYAELPDLSELEKTIDWSDINDLDESPAASNYSYDDTQELDINRL